MIYPQALVGEGALYYRVPRGISHAHINCLECLQPLEENFSLTLLYI